VNRRLRILLGVALPLVAVAILALVTFVPLPLPTTVADREAALNVALDALLSGTPVDMPEGKTPLSEREFALRNPQQLYFRNGAKVSDAIFLLRGLRPLTSDDERVFEQGGAIIAAIPTDHDPRRWRLQFSYSFGTLGGHEYEIRIYKSLIKRRIVFVH
jgi:hypothetical protein